MSPDRTPGDDVQTLRLLGRRRALACLLMGAGAALASCERRESAGKASRAAGPLRIAVTIPPLGGLVRALSPADARITVLMAPGRSEHGYEFTPNDLAELGRADVVVYIGLHLEPRVEGFLSDHPRSNRVDVRFADAAGVKDGGPGDGHDGHDHKDHGHEHHDDHGGHDEHAHGTVDPHVWLDPVLVMGAVPALAAAIRRGAEDVGAGTADLAARAAGLTERLVTLDRRYREALAPFAGASIVTHHSAWGRLAERYGLRVASVIREIEGGEPTPGAIAASVAAIKAEGVKTVFVEPQFSPDAARRIAEVAGVNLGTLDPLGDGDYFAMMERNLAELVKGLGR